MSELESYRQWMHPAHEFAPKMRTLADFVEPGTPTKGNEFVITTSKPIAAQPYTDLYVEWAAGLVMPSPKIKVSYQRLGNASVPIVSPEANKALFDDGKPAVTYSRYCSGCHSVIDSPEAFNRVWCENCTSASLQSVLAMTA